MKISWKFKSFIFSLIDLFNATSLLYFLQKHVTKRARIANIDVSPIWRRHRNILQKFNATSFILEFGAGQSLVQNLYLSDLVEKQLLVDLNPMIDFDLVESARKLLSQKYPLRANSKIYNDDDLNKYGIWYRAPYDASSTDIGDSTLDACISTNTLEHIPPQSIENIFNELYRVLKPTGIVSAKIDYSDHYAHTDKNISLFNYLKYSNKEWKKYNHNCHYQNRLRHYEYIKIFKVAGFDVIDEELIFDEKNIPADITELYKEKDMTWQATSAHIVLRKN